MAYNLQSLITILQQILNPQQTRWIVDHNKPQLQSLLEKSVSLQQILEKSPLTKIESLESQIQDAAHNAEDYIESHMVFKMISNPEAVSFTFSTPEDLQEVMQQLDSAMEQVVKLIEGKATSSGSSSSGVSFLHVVDSVQSKAVVGVDEDMRQLTDRLTGYKRKLEIVPIVGMGGIGKTTLARKLYQDPAIVEHFTCLAWATVSQDYNMQAILLSLLRCIIGKELCDQHAKKESGELKDILYRSLYGRRYIIVLDDVWSIQSWDEIRLYLPDNNSRSRIMITTRESEVAKHADSRSVQHQVQLLSQSTSWDMLSQIVFEEKCPDFLQVIGEKIARDCGGLPLAINVIGGLLSKVERSIDAWENVAKDVRAAIAESDEQFSDILSLSYNYLPNHLKPCFLYMGAFPEDYEIKISKLVCLWIAEGLVKSNGDKSLEEEAEEYLKALVERNLLLIRCYKSNGKAKSCSIHDLLWDLSLRKAHEDKFLHVKNSPNPTVCLVEEDKYSNGLSREVDIVTCQHISSSRRVSAHTSSGMEVVCASAKLISLCIARSFMVRDREQRMTLSSDFFCLLRLVRVLDVMDVKFSEFPTELLQLVNLRFLAVYCDSSIPSGISRLWNLQTLIAKAGSEMPCEIWELSELRYLKLVLGIMWYENEYVKQIVCKKLQMISWVELTHSLIRDAFFDSIPNIKELAICYLEDFKLSVVDLSHLHKLETLKFRSSIPRETCSFWSTFKFPIALRKLTLNSIAIFPRVSTLLCALPDLEVLKLDCCGFRRKDEELKAPDQEWEALEDEEWEVPEGDEFRSLRFLCLSLLDLKHWRADDTNFPKLRHLCIKHCSKLEKIPSEIGEIVTLQSIEIRYCSDSIEASARQIQEVQQLDNGNYDLKLSIKRAEQHY